MNELSLKARRLRRHITEAFSTVVYPGNDNICDDSQKDSDYYNTLTQFTGKHWLDLVPKRKTLPGRCNPLSNGMCFLSTSAWHFFLPACLIAELKSDYPKFYFLRPPPPGGLKEHMEQRYSRLNNEQCQVMVSVLEFADAYLAEKQSAKPKYEGFYLAQREKIALSAYYWRTMSATSGERCTEDARVWR